MSRSPSELFRVLPLCTLIDHIHSDHHLLVYPGASVDTPIANQIDMSGSGVEDVESFYSRVPRPTFIGVVEEYVPDLIQEFLGGGCRSF